MCGIAGKFNYQTSEPVAPALLESMCACIAHRGPDDQGAYFDNANGIGLGHRRLSIIDLSTGHQPMSDASGDYWIVFNGEIYNFPELKKELAGKGVQFRTKSDTEVILELYKQEGVKGFTRLNGIFAFALYDKRQGGLVLARDHFGVKPLYYRIENGALLFGSEIKAILQDPSGKRALDFEALNSFLTFRYNPSPQTLFQGIRKLPPAHYLRVDRSGRVIVASYWDYSAKTDLQISEAAAIEEYQRLLEQAVRRQMLSDVPVGLLLSGGLDSAVIGRLMHHEQQEKIKTFTVGFEGTGAYNELADARATAALIGSEHFEVSISQKEYIDFFLDSFRYTEEPIAETTIPALYYVARLASQHVKVVLAGQGADEPLAGYPRYLGEKYLTAFGGGIRFIPLRQIAALLRRNQRLKRAGYASQFRNEQERFLGIYTIFTPLQKSRLLNRASQDLITNGDTTLLAGIYGQTSGLHDGLSRILYLDTRMMLPDDLLLFGDKMTMANSLEMRVPFLDLDLISFLETLPSSFKLRGSTGKYIHRKAASKWLPRNIIRRKKRGFATPMDQWLQSGLGSTVKRLVNDRESACRQYFNVGAITKMIDDHQRRREDFHRHIFAILSFELWHKTVFQGCPVDREMFLAAGIR